MKNLYQYIIIIGLLAYLFPVVSGGQETEPRSPSHLPEKLNRFRPLFHFPPVNQDTTNVCWSFATLSFIESEMERLNGHPVKLAVMFPVYYAFIEKTKQYVASKGNSRLTPGDLFPTVIEIIQKYGILPEEAYHGQVDGSPVYCQLKMESEIEALKTLIQKNDLWNEETVLKKLTAILDRYLGRPPGTFMYQEKLYTAKSFAARFVNLPWPDYLLVTSFSYAPFWSFVRLEVPDNWRHLDTYYNVPLGVFYSGIISALKNGYSLAIDGDINEPGRQGKIDSCFIPPYDIPSVAIDQAARDYRFDYKITTDDHLMHIIGYLQNGGEDLFLVKDSWRDAWEGKFRGYFFFHGDYIRLKVLSYLVHKDAVPEIRDKISASR
jgi:bleomycin hydrolase